MWRVESGVEEGMANMKELVIHMLVDVDSNNKELHRSGWFVDLNEAERIAKVLNGINVHSAVWISNYFAIQDFLEALIEEQEYTKKMTEEAKKAIDMFVQSK
jgi:hypothetical protein